MTRLALSCFALILGLTSELAAQSPAFEVVSIKPSNPDAPGPSGMPVGGRYNASNMTLRQLVLIAYELNDFQLAGGPDWQTSRRFDIQAKAKDPVSGLTAMLPMIRTLLTDRFQLKVHTETRETPTYALVVARADGQPAASVKRSTVDCSAADADLADTSARGGSGTVAGLLQAGTGLPCAIMPVPARVAGSMTMRANAASMADLTRMLTPATGRVVRHRTGLSGRYDWELTFDRAVRLQAAPQPGGNPASDSPPLMTALQEQLGLKLEPARGPVEILVIDSATIPDAN